MRKHQGFTLVEIVIVCLIIGIILAIGVPSYFRSVEVAKCKEAMRNLQTMYTAAFDYYAENNSTFAGLTIAAINTQAGVYIVNNPDWTYGVGNLTSSTFTFTSTRLTGAHVAAGHITITLDQDSNWAGSYPHDDPGNF
jgi:prepilin-type N-terminal cleavage/methylation domain-containing protein